ncbi:5'-3' exoribonuclease 1 [Ostrinia furnacalis]|uniref:5'-3' exoribonuclease 1 n=1 Tax=Ostrinia furnacalis TaxID=93504 RepID=UPI001038D64A|nr:5'-3' exoribonuclease 1 [Ostrinia furnacalis]
MGVPKFFRYTSERYPCLNELVKQYQIPEFDNMYLDMNGIIHNCSHPDDSNPHFRITEEKIFQDIFHYLSILFQIIKPKKLFFMAIDGVAPRAKMNQQRGRRFRSAREAEQLEENAKAKGEVLPTEKRFDSNCITPGTVFMARLHEQLRFFVKEKMSTDPLWSKVKVILSGHETPGEGEHKIMDYIRWSRSQPGYDPNTRHCLYGLDADLIMLGMCTHEPHFALLREEVKFGKTTQRATSPEETNFYLLHLSLLREYLEQEFMSIKDSLPFEYDLEKIVDDWVLMGFLVGNDFIPHLPHMHISNDALPLLYKTYMKVLPTLDGYINEAGDLNLQRFEIFMQELAKIDKEKFNVVYVDLKFFEAKTGRRPNAQERKQYKPNNDETFNVDVEDIKNNKPDDDLQALINATEDMFLEEADESDGYEETSDEEANIEMEFLLHKKDYYMNKLDYTKVTKEVLADQAEGYVRAIQWNLWYYYKGCASWCWYYPHHYAPYISDIKGFSHLKIEFEKGEPFKPFEQLLAVLPSASKHLLPTPFHELMTEEDSPIVHYYPVHFETDLNGKKNDWEAVVLIPFIDETNLLLAMAPCYEKLTEEEIKRNTHGPMLVYNWTAASQGVEHAPEYFQPIADCHAIETKVWRQELEVPAAELKRGMLPNAMRDMIFPGFPTMKHLKYKSSIKKCKVKVFDQPSRNESLIVTIVREPDVDDSLEKVAQELLGKVIWVGWPHLTRSKVISVSNEKMRLHYVDKQNNNVNGAPNYTTEANFGNLHKQWISERSTIIEHNMNRLGIDLETVDIIIHAVNLKGYKYMIQDNVAMVREPEWCSVACGYARHAVVTDVSAHVVAQTSRFHTPQEAYPPGDKVFLLTQGQYYGCLATLVESEGVRNGRMKVQVTERPEPVPVLNSSAMPYRGANHAAAQCGISTQMLSRVTGSVLVVAGERHDLPTEQLGKTNIGLNLKFNKKNQEVSGYTRRCKVSNTWLYSDRCIALVKSYAMQYPDLFDTLARNLGCDIFFESDLWPNEMGQKKANEVQNWLKSLPHNNAVRRECGSEALEPEELKALWGSLEKQLQDLKHKEKKVTLQVKWNLLYKAELHEGNIQPDPSADYKLYDRVVCVARGLSVPAGAVGTVTAVYPPPNANTVRLSDRLNAEPTYQVMFDEPFPGGMHEELFDEARFYRMLPTNMLNISYGRKLRNSVVTAAPPSPSYHITQPPTLLRREDGHHSAFASYSPPTPEKAENKPLQDAHTFNNVPPPLDNGTNLLRTLLKISEDEDSSKKKSNKTTTDTNWRAKNDTSSPSTTTAQSQQPKTQQPSNWRKEMATKPPPGFSNEWTNNTYKNQPPVPPFPAFNQPFQGPVPGPTQIPFPQFQNPHFARNPSFGYHGNQDSQRQHHQQASVQQANVQYRPYQPGVPAFPKHLPTVSGNNITLGPSWVQGQNLQAVKQGPPPPSPGARPPGPPQPFVPLQVQTSRSVTYKRSVVPLQPNASGSSVPINQATAQPPAPYQPQPPNQVPQQKQDPASRPQKKKKPRIAANLPFQIE